VFSQIFFGFFSLGLININDTISALPLGNADVLRVIPEDIWLNKLLEWISFIRGKNLTL
jgi:hypothetical protein